MSAAVAAGAVGPAGRRWPWTAYLIVGIALLFGLALGDPSPTWWIPLGLAVLGMVLAASVRWPFESLLLMIGSAHLLVVVRVAELRSVNLIDLLLPPVLLVSVLGGVRRAACAEREAGSGHQDLLRAERGLTRWVVFFYALATLSLFQLARLAGASAALDSSLYLFRAFQALSFFPLCLWWLRDRAHVERAWGAIFVAGAALIIVNIVGVAFWGVKRGGMTFFLNNWDAPLADPNETGPASLIIGAVLLIRHAIRPQARNLVLGVLMLMMVGLTQSRSSIIAWAVFGLFTLRWIRPSRILTGALVIGALLPLLPRTFWIRMSRTLSGEQDSFEMYSIFFRFSAGAPRGASFRTIRGSASAISASAS